MSHIAFSDKDILDKKIIKKRYGTYSKRNALRAKKEMCEMYSRTIQNLSNDEAESVRTGSIRL